LITTADVTDDPIPSNNHDVHDLSLYPLNGSTWDDAVRSFKIY
jgi:hypothetical protein